MTLLDYEHIRILENLEDLYEVDDSFLEKLLEHSGKGTQGKHETLHVSMAKYHLEQVRDYLTMITEGYYEKDWDRTIGVTPFTDDDWEEEDGGEPLVIFNSDGSTYCNIDRKESTMGSLAPTTTTYKTYKPPHNDDEKLKIKILEVIDEAPKDLTIKPGFQGWLAAEVTGLMGGKTDPKIILSLIREVLEEYNGV